MKSIKDFISRDFFYSQLIWLTFSLSLIFVTMSILQLRSGIESTRDKIDTIIEYNQSEIFSSIVLNDYESLKDHLELIKKQVNLDYVALVTDDQFIQTEKKFVPISFSWISLLNPTYSKTAHNEFKTISFQFEAKFGNSIITDNLIPYMRLSLLTLLVIIGVLYLFFKKQMQNVHKDIIVPITDLVEKIENDQLDENEKSFKLKELHVLHEVMRSYPKLKKDSTIAEISSQVAHDIRSPLEALKSAKDEIDKLPELERKTISKAIGRIEEIAYSLLINRKHYHKNEFGQTHVLSCLNEIIQEKKLQFRNFPNLIIELSTTKGSFVCFIEMKPETFKRIISNLITNAAEAVDFNGFIKIHLEKHGDIIKLKISDSGPHIPDSLLINFFEEGFTTKINGNGLGLYNAKKEIEHCKGTISISNKEYTCIEIITPIIEAPKSFVASLNLTGKNKIIILDDDESIHNVWRKRFKNCTIEMEHFYKASDLLKTYTHLPESIFLLTDYELLGEKINGIECIQKLKAYHNSILVTARADEIQIIKDCLQDNIKILPKSIAHEVEIISNSSNHKAVLIDDDKLTHLAWKLAAKKSQTELLSYTSIDDFLREQEHLDRNTTIYIDSNLGENLRGETLSLEIHKLGFTELYLSTGYSSNDFEKPKWIKEILSKAPPFFSNQS